MLNETAIAKALNAKPLFELWKAADQDGYDGGWILDDGDGERWAQNKETLIREFYEREKFN